MGSYDVWLKLGWKARGRKKIERPDTGLYRIKFVRLKRDVTSFEKM